MKAQHNAKTLNFERLTAEAGVAPGVVADDSRAHSQDGNGATFDLEIRYSSSAVLPPSDTIVTNSRHRDSNSIAWATLLHKQSHPCAA